jgi:hypothetical protein
VPPGSPLKSVAAVMALGMGGAGILAFGMLKRWRARGNAPAGAKKGDKTEASASDEQLDARVDAELKALDD